MPIRDLIERRTALKTEAQALLASPEGENGDLSEAQEKRFDEITTESDTLEKRIDRQSRVDEIERRAGGTPTQTGDEYSAELRNYSLVRAIAGAAGLAVDDAREREIAQEVRMREGREFQGLAVPLEALTVEKRTVSTSTPGAGPGSNLIPTVQSTEVIDVLRSSMVTTRLGARTITGLRGDLDIPKLTKSSATGWFAEGSAITEDDPEYGSVPLRPKHVGALSSFSRNMLLQSSPDVEQLMRTDMAEQIARAIDAAATSGAGGTAPTGIVNVPGIIAETTAASGVIDEDDVIDTVSAILEADATVTGMAMHPTVAKELKKLKDSEGRPLNFISGLGNSATIDGTYPTAISTSLPTFAGGSVGMIAGDWSDLLIGMWSGIDILTNPYATSHYERGAVGVRAIATADVAVRRPKSFATLTVQA